MATLKYDHAKFIIDRFDHYYDTVNNKGAFYIGINTFILGGICAGYFSLYDQIDLIASCIEYIIFCSLITSCIVSTIFTICAITPFTKSSQIRSFIFFESVSSMDYTSFITEFKNQTEAEIETDAISQVQPLAMGLHIKFHRLKWASYFLQVEYILLIVCLLITISKLISK